MSKLLFVATASAALALTACGDTSSSTASNGAKDIQPYEILDRTAYIIDAYGQKMEADGNTVVTGKTYEELSQVLTMAYNTAPAVSAKPLGVASQEDGSFVGFTDANGDNVQDAGEKKMFDMAYDPENTRLVLTDYTGESSGYRISGTGLLAGYIIGSMMTRSRRAGVPAGKYSNVRDAKPARRAATRTRTGGSRAGK